MEGLQPESQCHRKEGDWESVGTVLIQPTCFVKDMAVTVAHKLNKPATQAGLLIQGFELGLNCVSHSRVCPPL